MLEIRNPANLKSGARCRMPPAELKSRARSCLGLTGRLGTLFPGWPVVGPQVVDLPGQILRQPNGEPTTIRLAYIFGM
jgi:hypothetical protein